MSPEAFSSNFIKRLRDVGAVLLLLWTAVIPPAYSQPWWNLNWKYRQCFEVREIGNYTLSSYLVKMVIDTHSLVSQGKMNPDCSDIRVVVGNQSLPYYFIGCDFPNITTLFFPISLNPYERKEGCIYYGNPQAYDQRDITIFPWYDNFENVTHFNENDWDLVDCERYSGDSYDGSWCLVCKERGHARVKVPVGNETYFAWKVTQGTFSFEVDGNRTIFYPNREWTVFNQSFQSPAGFIWEKPDSGFGGVDAVVVRSVVEPEPRITLKPEVVAGKQIVYLKTYCIDNYVVEERTVCTIAEGCEVNQTYTYCDYGCFEGKCNPSPYQRIIFVILAILGFLMVAVIIVKAMAWGG